MSKQISRDAEGYLVNPDEWSRDVAIELAGEESIQLNNELWNLLQFMRDFYAAHGIAPDVRHVVGYLSSAQHCSKKEAKKALFEAFSIRVRQTSLQDRGYETTSGMEHRMTNGT